MNGNDFQARLDSVAGAVARHARASPHHRALVTPGGVWTYQYLAEQVGRVADELRPRLPGACPVAIVMMPDVHTVAALLAAELIGHPAVLLGSSLPLPEVREVLRTSGAHVIITSAGEASQPNLPRVRWMPIADGLAFGALEPADFAPEPASSAFLCQQTSGSMGASKLALRTRDAVLLEISSLCDALALRSADVVMTASSVAHSYGCVGGLLAPLVAGASVVLTVGSRVESDLTATSPTILFGLGATYQALLAGRREPARGLTRIRLAFSAGAPLPDGLYQSFKERFDVQIRQDYGATEVGTISMDLESPAAPDTVGQVLPHIELDVLPPDVIALRGGERGEILVRSRAMAMGYLVDGRMVACTDAEGWYHTRDAGSFAGRSLVLGRRLREPIQVNGGPLDLEVVENEIRLLSGVLEVVAAPESSRDGLGLAAFVVAPTLSEPDIQRWCSDHLPEAHRPKRIVLLRELPRSPAGKILQKYLN